MGHKMKYKEYKDASNRLTISLYNCPKILYWWVKRNVKNQFSLKPINNTVEGLNESFQNFESLDGKYISIDWDNWSGFTITALNKKSEEFLLSIGEYLKKKYT